jgi:hypothetical protein
MTVNWIEVMDSDRVSAVAYDAEQETMVVWLLPSSYLGAVHGTGSIERAVHSKCPRQSP